MMPTCAPNKAQPDPVCHSPLCIWGLLFFFFPFPPPTTTFGRSCALHTVLAHSLPLIWSFLPAQRVQQHASRDADRAACLSSSPPLFHPINLAGGVLWLPGIFWDEG